jgi:molecular chaperone DnaJ
MQQKNYYSVLGVDEKASQADIKKAFRTLAKECHPDHHPGDAGAEARFKDISEAYEVLSDVAKRKKYDELRTYSTGQAQGSMTYEDFMRQFGGEQTGDAREFTWGFGGGLEDIFSSLFGGLGVGASRTRQRQPGFSFRSTSGQSRQPGRGSSGSTRPGAPSDDFFKREGSNAWVELPVNPAQLMLGSTVKVRTPDGRRVQVKIRPGTQPGAVLRVRGYGYQEAMQQGDLLIRMQLSIPKGLSEEQRHSVRELARIMAWKY